MGSKSAGAHIEKVNKVEKVVITDHGESKLGISDSDESRCELPEFMVRSSVKEQKGMLYYDSKHTSYVLVSDSTVIAFKVEGSKAVVTTGYRVDSHHFLKKDRFTRIN